MKEIIRLLLKDGKEFSSFTYSKGNIYLNYYEGRKLKTVDIRNNEDLNVRTVNTIETFIYRLLTTL